MVERCCYPRHPFYRHYGGRGITVCPRWLGVGGFARFLADVGERPAGMTLDREEVDGDYEPGNVRWATPVQQRWNRRDMRDALTHGLESQREAAEVQAVKEAMPF